VIELVVGAGAVAAIAGVVTLYIRSKSKTPQ